MGTYSLSGVVIGGGVYSYIITLYLIFFLPVTNGMMNVRAVNLGGWLVTEGWIKPSLFDGIPNKDFLDGTGLQFKSVTVDKFLVAENGGGSVVVANRSSASGWETFSLWRVSATRFQFRVFGKQFVGLESAGNGGVGLVTTAVTPGRLETFEIVRKSDDLNRVRIKAANGMFLQAKTEDKVTADFAGASNWGDDDPSVFIVTRTGGPSGEFQITNGYGPDIAPRIMNEHWSTYIVEKDFEFISKNGLNTVRIPVGWWIASDPNPPPPYVGGSLKALDNAFIWAQKYGLKVIIDLHAGPGSQNGFEHSSTRDGSQEWSTRENVIKSIDVIEKLTDRYAKSPSLYAVELLNEPSSSVPLNILKEYYALGHAVVRKHAPTAYVIMSNRLSAPDARELFDLARGLERSVIDTHYYNLFEEFFKGFNVEQNIEFVRNNRSHDVNHLTSSNGPLIFVGEWVAEWEVKNATKEDFQRFAKAQLDVYGRASFGWAYWTFKNVNNHWSMEWMLQNGYIKL